MTTTTSTRPGRSQEERVLQQHWHGWGSPVGLGIGLMSVGAFFVLIAIGLGALAMTAS